MRSSRKQKQRRLKRRRTIVFGISIMSLLILGLASYPLVAKFIVIETAFSENESRLMSTHLETRNTMIKSKEEIIDFEQDETELGTKDLESEPEINIIFAGDTMFDWDLRPILEQKGYDYPFQYIQEKVNQVDYSFINLESVFTEEPSFKSPDQLFWINSDVKALQAVENAGFKMANIGNNHTLDYLEPGLLDTLKNIKKTNMEYIGAGENEKEAYQSKEVMIKGKKFRFFCFVRFFPNANWVATDSKPGVPNGYDLNVVKNTIQEQKADADYTIVYFHWGIEKTNTPADYQKEYVKELKELGVDLIVGSHPHWLQGFEYDDGMAIAYSLGNFLFPPYVEGRSAESGLLTATFKGDDVQLSFDPYVIDQGLIVPAEGDLKQSMLQYLQDISFGVSIDKNGKITPLKKSVSI